MDTNTNENVAEEIPGNGQTLLIIVAIAVICVLYIALSHWAGVDNYWPGFLFLLFWAGIEKMEMAKLTECVLGAFVGMTMGYLLQTLPSVMGVAGFGVFLALVCSLVFCQIKQWLHKVVNMATMLFLTVTTIPFIQGQANFVELYTGLMIGVGFFGTLCTMVHLLMNRRAEQQQAA